MSFTYHASATGQAFLDCRSFVKIIMGPVGGGKSTVALMDLFHRALDQVVYQGIRRTKFVILRNTSAQLKATVKPLIDAWFGTMVSNKMGDWRLTDAVFEMKFKLPDGTIVHSEFMMLPADTPDDVRRLLSLECSAAWVEEMREVEQTIIEGLQGRVSRFPNRASGGVTYPGIIGSTNPPPMGSWLQEYMATPPANCSVFMQPPAVLDDGALNPDAENLENLDPDYYPNLMGGKSTDWVDVFLKNKYGAGGFGQPVFRNTFKLDFHVSKTKLMPVIANAYPLVVGLDNGLTAAAAVGQMDARGRLNILLEGFVPQGETMGVETFLDRIFIPKFTAAFGANPQHVLFVLDPACFQRSQVDEVTIAQAVQARGYKVQRASTNIPERRIAAVEGLLTRAIDGGPGLLISSECPWLAKAMDHGYRNRKQANGVFTAVPEKNHYSHIADALQYLALNYNAQVSPGGYGMRSQKREIQKSTFVYV